MRSIIATIVILVALVMMNIDKALTKDTKAIVTIIAMVGFYLKEDKK